MDSKEQEIAYGSYVSIGVYECADCGKRLTMGASVSIPPCPNFEESPHPKRSYKQLNTETNDPTDPRIMGL